MACMFATYKGLTRTFGGLGPVVALPFEPPAFLQKITHRGLTGADPREGSAVSWAGRGAAGLPHLGGGLDRCDALAGDAMVQRRWPCTGTHPWSASRPAGGERGQRRAWCAVAGRARRTPVQGTHQHVRRPPPPARAALHFRAVPDEHPRGHRKAVQPWHGPRVPGVCMGGGVVGGW